MNKLFIFIILFIGNFYIITVQANEKNSIETLDTLEGFPYKNLIMKAEKVELIYSNHDYSISCRVNVFNGEMAYLGKTNIVSVSKFEKVPMAACLTRPVAKKLLKQLSL